MSDGDVNGIRRNGNVVIFPTLIPSSLCMTPLTTPIFDFHKVISALTTPSLVKTSLIQDCDTTLKATPDNNLHFYDSFEHGL